MKTQSPRPSSGQPSARNATGPRTPQGKQRSKLNAKKHGLFFKDVLLAGESQSEYRALLDGLREYWHPVGTMESIEVEKLATETWRLRRFFAVESAVITGQLAFPDISSLDKQQVDASELSRNAIASGGLLMHSINNRFVIPEAVATLKLLRLMVNKWGFEENNRLVAKLCGDLPDGELANSFRLLYETFAAYAKLSEKQIDTSSDSQHRKVMVGHIDAHIEGLTELEAASAALDERKIMSKRCAGLIPDQSDRLLRYETHFERQIDRIVTRLELLQRVRKRQPLPPQVDVKIS